MKTSMLKQLFVATVIALAAGFVHAGELTVSAASSLTNAFKEIARSYETQHPGSKINLNFGASGALLQQMAKGAPVDVFASADQETMDAAEQQKLVAAADRRNFARNSLVLVVPVGGEQLPIDKLADLGLPAVQKVAIGNPASVPVGRYAQHALEGAGLWTAVAAKAILTENVRQSLDYVARGEVDAGFVYATDALLMPNDVKTALTVPLDIAITYPIAKTTASANAAEAARFIEFVLSPGGQAILNKFGFQKP